MLLQWLTAFRLRIKALFKRRQLDRDLDDELSFHLAMRAARQAESGTTAGDAHYAAQRRFGNTALLKERTRDMWTFTLLESLWQDIHFAARSLRKNPGFTAVAVITLALGIGANTAIFSVVNAIVLRPLPYPQSSRLVWIAESIPLLKAELAPGGDYVYWKDQNKTLDAIAAYDVSVSFNLTGGGTPARIHAAAVSASFFSTLGVEPQLGRGFTAREDAPNGPKVVILMDAFWEQYFGSDTHALGQTLTLDGAPYTVVGVMPASFRFPESTEAQMLVPLALNQAQARVGGMQRLVHIIGRLKPGVPLATAHADLDAILRRVRPRLMSGPIHGAVPKGRPGSHSMFLSQAAKAPPAGGNVMMGVRTAKAGQTAGGSSAPGLGAPPHDQMFLRSAAGPPSANHKVALGTPLGKGFHPKSGLMGPPEINLKVIPLAEHLAGNLRPAMLILLGVVGLVLLIACANVANLMLTRASARSREMAVRAAFGAGRWRIIRQSMTESVTLALIGGAAGLLLAAWGVAAITRLIPPSLGGGILNLTGVHIDLNVLLFVLAISIATGILFGLAPAYAVPKRDLAERLKEGAQATTGTPQRGWMRQILAVAELALALVLLAGAGLLIKSFYRVLAVKPGFAPQRVLTLNLNLTDSRYPTPQQKSAFFTEVLRRVESLPGVRSAAMADSLPLSPVHVKLMIPLANVARAGGARGSLNAVLSRITVSPAYFYTLGIPLLKGRTFTDHDDAHSGKVAVINEALAHHVWPNEDPIGKQIPLLGSPLTVVGVVGNTHHEGPSQDIESTIYVPYLQQSSHSMQLAVRTAADPDSLVSAVRAQIADVDAEQPIYNITTLEQTLSASMAPRRFNMLLLALFAAIALILATVGVYSVMAFSVTQRTNEIGVRMALGARRSDILRLVVGRGATLVVLGIVCGLAGAIALTRFLSSLLFGVRPTDPMILAVGSILLAAVAVAASYIPARRAARVDPMVALRHE